MSRRVVGSTLLKNCATVLLLFLTSCIHAEVERTLRVPESAAIGHQIGFVQDPLPKDNDQQNFYVVFTNPNSQAEKVFIVFR